MGCLNWVPYSSMAWESVVIVTRCPYFCTGSLPPQRSDQHQPTSAPPIMQAAAAAGPPLVAATPYSSYISYNPQQFTGQPTMMQPMAHYPSQVGVTVLVGEKEIDLEVQAVCPPLL